VPLNNAPILIVCSDALIAHALVKVVSAARGDVVYAVNDGEAAQRLRQFSFSGAVLGDGSGHRRCDPADTWRAILNVRGACDWYCGNRQRFGRRRDGSGGTCARNAVSAVAGVYASESTALTSLASLAGARSTFRGDSVHVGIQKDRSQ
jgi:hypothetical protein